MPFALACSVEVTDDGALLVRWPHDRVERRAEPGTVTRVLYLDADTTARRLGADASALGSLVVVTDRPVLAVRLMDWAPPAMRSDAVVRRTSGAVALAQALGVPLEPGDVDAPLQAVEVRPLPAPVAPGKAVRALWPVGSLAGFLALPLAGSAVSVVLAVVSLLCSGAAGVPLVRARREAGSASAEPLPAIGTVIGVRPTVPVASGLLASRLDVGTDEIVLRRSGTVVVLPGPAAGGVVQAVMEPTHVRLADQEGLDYAALETGLWCGDDRARAELADDLRAAGLTVLDSPLSTAPSNDHGDLATSVVRPSFALSLRERGDPTLLAPFLVSASAACSFAASLAAIGVLGPAAAVLVVPAAALLWSLSVAGLRRRREDRRFAVRSRASATTG